jgi:hypothetical protein
MDVAEQALRDARARIGLNPLDQRRYNVSVNTGYTFRSGLLKGVRIGAGCRWLSPNVIGWARAADGNFDPERRYRGDDVWTTSASINYTRKLLGNRITWSIQLNLYNLLDNDEYVARNAVDDGTGKPVHTSFYPVEPFRAQLTNTFKF